MKQILFLSIMVMQFSCGAGDDTVSRDETKAIADNSPMTDPTKLNGCYLLNIGKDTARLRVEFSGQSVKGDLSYDRYEKDSNKGTIEGSIHDDMIKVWYRFSSEGTISVRAVQFKVIGDKLAEGYGEMDMRNDTAYFKFPTTLRYEEKNPYLKINCN